MIVAASVPDNTRLSKILPAAVGYIGTYQLYNVGIELVCGDSPNSKVTD